MCLLGALVLAGCGESEQSKAEKSVCEAKTEISTGVEGLKQGAQALNATQIKGGVEKVAAGLQKLGAAESKASATRKQEIQQANAALSSELHNLEQHITSLSLGEAKAQIAAAAQKLAESYKQALAPIKC